MAKVQPLYDRVLIKPLEEDQTTASGIIIPDTASKERPQKGKVLAAGPGRTENGQQMAMSVKEGDTVLFSKYGPSEIKLDGEELLIAEEKEILAILS